ncbi:MAG: NAD-dependent epimerase/dehydratase family protein [Gemmatimonadota bacterium]
MRAGAEVGVEILVIGGTRFLGRHVVLGLLARGHRVAVLNRGLTADDLPGEVERLRADRTRPGELAAALAARAFEGVVDMVAYRAAESREAIEALSGRCSHYIHIGTGQVYLVLRPPVAEPAPEGAYDGELLAAPPPGTRDHAAWLYGVEKRGCEDVLREATARGFPATVLRLPMVQGERDSYRRLEAYAARAADGGPVLVPEGPARPLRHVDRTDVVRAVAQLLETGMGKGRVYNLSQDEALPLEEFLRILAEALGAPIRTAALPRAMLEAEDLLPACSPFSDRWMSVIDNGRAKRELGLRFTPPQEYLPRIVRAGLDPGPAGVPGYENRPRELALVGGGR